MSMISNKQAFVLDTNFIIQNRDIDRVISQLKERFVVYVPQFTIDERVAQQYREINEKYNKIESLIKDLKGIISVRISNKQDDLRKYIIAPLIKPCASQKA